MHKLKEGFVQSFISPANWKENSIELQWNRIRRSWWKHFFANLKGQAYLKGHDYVTKEGRKERNAYCKIHNPRNIWKIHHSNTHLQRKKHMLTNTSWGETNYKRSRCWNYNELPIHTHEWELFKPCCITCHKINKPSSGFWIMCDCKKKRNIIIIMFLLIYF